MIGKYIRNNIMYGAGLFVNPIKDKKESILHYAKRKFGLIPKDDEDIDAFSRRVHETVTDPDDLNKNIIFKKINENRPKETLTETTEEVQKILDYFLGIEKVPIEAFEKNGKLHGSAKGLNIYDPDGSSIAITQDMPDNTDRLIIQTALNLERLINNIEIPDHLSDEITLADRLIETEKPIDLFYKAMIKEFFKNETFIKLHEGIHGVDANNTEEGMRRRTRNKLTYIMDHWKTFLPVVGILYQTKSVGFHIETESRAFKYGLDAFSDYILDNSIDTLERKISNDEISTIKNEVKRLNTKFAKGVMTEAYLSNPTKFYGNADANYSKAMVNGMYGVIFASNGSLVGKSIGCLMVLNSARYFAKIPFAIFYKKKLDAYIDTLEELSDKHGVKKAYFETMGMDFNELRDYAKRP